MSDDRYEVPGVMDDYHTALTQLILSLPDGWEVDVSSGVMGSLELAKLLVDAGWRKGAERVDVLTAEELQLISDVGALLGRFIDVAGGGANSGADLAEVAFHVHALQEKVMSQAAARAYPDRFRLLGQSLRRVSPVEGLTGPATPVRIVGLTDGQVVDLNDEER